MRQLAMTWVMVTATAGSGCVGGGSGGYDAVDGGARDTRVADGAAAMDTGPSTTDTGGRCQDACTLDARRCAGASVEICGVDDLTGCLSWAAGPSCGAGETCSNGTCSAQCSDECLPAGTRLCDAGGVKTCGQYDADSCTDWSTVVACRDDETCVNGACVVTCTDECLPEGTRLCDGSGVKSCGQHDGDACLEWSATQPCAGGCVNGACVGGCQDACTSGEAECLPDGTIRRCEPGSEGCLVWSSPAACPALETCVDGACSSTCGAGCGGAGATSCSGENGYKVCGVDLETGCQAESPFIGCQAGSRCDAGACGGGCVVPEVILVVDRSSSMLGDVWDYTRDGLNAWAEAVEAQVKIGARAFPASDSGCEPGAVVGLAADNAAGLASVLAEPSEASSTPLAAALTGLAPAFGDPNQGEHVVLVTDGSETCGSADDLLDQVQALRNRGTTVHVVGVGSGFDTVLLQQVVDIGGGRFLEARSAAALAAALSQLTATVTACGAIRDGYSVCEEETCAAVGCAEGTHACGNACPADDDPAACGEGCEVCPGTADGQPACVEGACTVTCDEGFYLVGGACLDCAAPTAGDLVINELMPDHGGTDFNTDGQVNTRDEWVEILNVSGKRIALEGLEVRSGPVGETWMVHTFSGGCVEHHEAIVVFGGTEALPADAPGVTWVAGSAGALALNNSGDAVELVAPGEVVVEAMSYTSSSAVNSWTRSPDGTGEFVYHDDAAGSAGRHSMGTCVDGEAFPGCLDE